MKCPPPVDQPVDHGDIEMVQRRQYPGLAAEARKSFRISGQRVREHFDGCLTIELSIASAIHLAHATRAKRGEDFVGAEFFAGGDRHLQGLAWG